MTLPVGMIPTGSHPRSLRASLLHCLCTQEEAPSWRHHVDRMHIYLLHIYKCNLHLRLQAAHGSALQGCPRVRVWYLSDLCHASLIGLCVCMCAVVIVGQIVGATEFDDGGPLMCRWELVSGTDHWSVVRGETSGKTHLIDAEVCYRVRGVFIERPLAHSCSHVQEGDLFVWCHPIEVHYSTSSIQGWPQLSVQVWRQDEHNRSVIGTCMGVAVRPGVGVDSLATSRLRLLSSPSSARHARS